MSSLRCLGVSIHRTISRSFHQSAPAFGKDLTRKRLGHVTQSDKIEGEGGLLDAPTASLELIDENISDRIIKGVKFRDIPVIKILCTRNNTKMYIAKGDGRPIVLRTAGTEGYKHCRKGTTVAAQAVANRIVTIADEINVKMARLVFEGMGPGRAAAYKVLELSNIDIVSLSDRTSAIEPWIQRPRKAKRI